MAATISSLEWDGTVKRVPGTGVLDVVNDNDIPCLQLALGHFEGRKIRISITEA